MIKFLSELKRRNKILYLFGWLCLAGTFVCILMMQIDHTQVLGINAWIKPLKFFLSIAIFSWTMAWYLFYLEKQKKVKIYSRMVVVVMVFELFVIVWQAANGRMSHFNVTTRLYAALFSLMGIAITILTVWTARMAWLFFRQKKYTVPMTYIWGIRIGMIFFVFFAFEGGVMAAKLAHTVGGPDGSPGLPLFNWSRIYGDLRVAHFFGMHSLQILPLFGYWLAKTNKQVFIFSALYLIWIGVLLVQAIYGIPAI